jgi:lipopolysaccharide/colanic/teichoic acid biosynthesis glycosyltransferase
MLRDSERPRSANRSLCLRRIPHRHPRLPLFPPGMVPSPVRPAPERFADRLARFGDLALAWMLLVLVLPLMLLIALAIRCEGSGPILEWQQRIGCDGRVVNALRFRTTHAAPVGTQWFRRKHRTGVGALLWRTHLDGIPMLINVLRGEMTIIGRNGRARLVG